MTSRIRLKMIAAAVRAASAGRRLPVPGRRPAGVCAMVSRHRQAVARGRVFAGTAQSPDGRRAGLGLAGPGHDGLVDAGLVAGAGQRAGGAVGQRPSRNNVLTDAHFPSAG